MNVLARCFVRLVATILFAWAGAATAQVPAICTSTNVTKGQEVLDRLNGRLVGQCLVGKNCTSELCTKVADFENRWKGKPATEVTYREARGLFDEIRASASTLPANGLAVPQLRAMFTTWSSALGTANAVDLQRLKQLEVKQWEPETSDFRLFARNPAAEIVLKDKVNPLCNDSPAECVAALAQASDVIGHSLQVAHVLRALGATAGLSPYFETLNLKWAAYNNESRAIYPWELWLNGRLIKASAEGFVEPPDRQFLFLHPGAGMTYRPSRSDQDSDARGIITVDAFGIYRWRWGGANGTQITDASGWSIAGGWDGRRWGYGIGLHFSDNRSVYLMRDRDRRTLLVVSLDLGNYLMDKDATTKDWRKAKATQN